LTLNRPHVKNALSRELRRLLVETLHGLAAKDDTGVIILTGAGEVFSAGLDLKELSAPAQDGEQESPMIDEVMGAFAAFDRPIIGAVNGPAITGGFELALACDILIASPEARFADTHARVGVLPRWGMSQKLPRLIGPGRAKELSFTGNYLSAEGACVWGLVNRVVSAQQLLPTCRALAADMLSCDPEALRSYKRLINQGYGLPLFEGLALELKVSDSRKAVQSPEHIASRREALLRRGRNQSAG